MLLRRVASARVSAAWRAQALKAGVRRVPEATAGRLADSRDWSVAGTLARDMRMRPSFIIRSFTTSVKAPTVEAKSELVEQLRPLCSALYKENRVAEVGVEQLVARWEAEITPLLQDTADSTTAIQHTYEQGIAIALKQRERALAEALVAQMQRLGVAPTVKIYQFRVRAVALEWMAREAPLSLDELRALDLGANWEHTVLELVRTEEQPHYRKSRVEREKYHAHLRDGVARVLADYEQNVPKDQQRIEPYNEAVRVLADNGVPFAQQLRVLNSIPRDSKARSTLNVDTFLALLEGARWQDIPLTLERLTKSNVLRELEAADDAVRSRTAARLWDETMRAICNSHSERFFNKKQQVESRRLRDLQNIYRDVDAQLRRVFPDLRFNSIEELTAVFEIRVKAAAWLGLPRQVIELLDEYKAQAPVEAASGQLGKSVVFKALEIFPISGLRRVGPMDVERASSHSDVLDSPEVLDVQRTIEELQEQVPEKKEKLKLMQEKIKENTSDSEMEKLKTVGRDLRKTQQTIARLNKRLDAILNAKALEVAHKHRMQNADRWVQTILGYLPSDQDPRTDLDVAVVLMNQYMTTANRFASRMSHSTREFMASEVMERVFKLVDFVVGEDASDKWTTDEERTQIKQLFALAAKTAASFWCEEDLQRLLRRKQAALGTDKLDAEDYDRLVFLRVAQHDLGGAYDLLQEMHFAGTAPTPTTIHRVVTGVLHKLSNTPKKQKVTIDGHEDDDIDLSDGFNDALEDEESIEQAWSNGPSRLEDIPSFLQEWYNLHRVKPMSKTVVPVFARLLAANNVWEVKRLLQILDSMDGGLSPVTELWLEKRLAAAGKSVEDLRLR